MSYSPSLSSTITNTKMRIPENISSFSGMCFTEDVVAKDSELVLKDNRVAESPLLKKMVGSFKEYDHGYGQIILQGNVDDESLGVLDYAIEKLRDLGAKQVCFKMAPYDPEDIIALTKEAAEVAGIPSFMDLKKDIVKMV